VKATAGKLVMFNEAGEPRTPDLLRSDFDTGGGTRFDLPRFLVVNAGWVGVYQLKARLVVFLRPAKVCAGALSGALYWIADAVTASGVGSLIVLDGAAPIAFEYPDRYALLQAVCDTVNAAQPPPSDRFARRNARRSELASNSPLLGIANIWHELNGQLDIERMWRLLHGDLGRRFILLTTDPDAMRIKRFGGGFETLPSYWESDMRGSRVRDQPDLAYGRWIENAYREADAIDGPVVEAIDCEVDWPREGLRCHRYWRVTVPFALDGQRLVLGATISDVSISLRDGRGSRAAIDATN